MGDAKVWLKNAKGVEVISLTKPRLAEALALMRDSYYPDESAAKGVELHKSPEAIDELEQLTIETFLDGTTLVAIYEGKIVGCAFNKVQTKPHPGDPCYFEDYRDLKCKTEVGKEYVQCMIQADSMKDAFEHYGVTKSLELMFLGVSRKHRGLGIGTLLAQSTCKVAESRKIPIVTAIFTSIGSQTIGKRLEWDQLIIIPMSDFVFRGRPYSDFTGENQRMILMGKRTF